MLYLKPLKSSRQFSRSTARLAQFMVLGLVGCQVGPKPALPAGDANVRVTADADVPMPAPAVLRSRPRPMPTPVRAVWVARMHYRYEDDVRTIIRNCADLGFNTIFWQVRGNGTVAFRSRLEPWLEEFEFHDPGFDPLAVAVHEAHANGLRIEAWVNVMPGWRGKRPPPVAEQLYNAHPAWFWYDAAGRRQPLGDFYVSLNPCLPDARRHIVSVLAEIVSRYDVDGLHLDYIRYAFDTMMNMRNQYPRDAATLAMFQRQTGKNPDADPDAWDSWRANQISRLVGEIRAMLDQRRPGATLTAAVWVDPARAYREALQNGGQWLRAGLVDALVPMAYTEDAAKFEHDVDAYRAQGGNRRIVPGLGIYKHSVAAKMGEQLQACAERGGDFALFSYESLMETAGDRSKTRPDPKEQQARLMRRSVLARFVGK
ncbi:MAG: family 10 glycosylhydrolase [Phycisphaerae bacterium]